MFSATLSSVGNRPSPFSEIEWSLLDHEEMRGPSFFTERDPRLTNIVIGYRGRSPGDSYSRSRGESAQGTLRRFENADALFYEASPALPFRSLIRER